MKNDYFHKLNNKSSVSKSKTPQFSNEIFSIPITNTNDSYIIETINSSNSIESSDEFQTSGLQEGLIYRNNFNGLRFWTQILKEGQQPFISSNFYNYYNRPPSEFYALQVEVIKMNYLKSSDSNGLSDPYYIAQLGNEQFKSRVIYCNLNPIYYDEFQLKIHNLEQHLIISVFDKDKSKDEFLGSIEIDITSEPFGEIVEKEYPLNPGSIFLKWQVTEVGQSRWDEKLINIRDLNQII